MVRNMGNSQNSKKINLCPRRQALAAAFLFMHFFYVFGQNDIKFQNITINDGLSQNTINCIFHDSQGYLWVGTESGLNRYDGYAFRVFLPDNDDPKSISNSNIVCIFEDSQHVLWIGTTNGLNVFNRDNENFTVFKHNRQNPKSISNNWIFSIKEDSASHLWMGTDQGLNMYDRNTNEFTPYFPVNGSPVRPYSIRALTIDPNDQIWMGTFSDGLIQFNPKTRSSIQYLHDPNSLDSLGSNSILSLLIDYDGTLWVGTTANGLTRFDRKENRFTHFQLETDNPYSLGDNRVYCLLEDSHRVLWIGTMGGGAQKFDRAHNRFIHYRESPGIPFSYRGTNTLSIHEDQTGILWFGTASSGLNKWDPSTQKFSHFFRDPNNPNSLSSNRIRKFHEDPDGVLWIGTDGGGLDRYDPNQDHYTHFRNDPNDDQSLSDDRVWSILVENEETYWIGTFGSGLNKFNPKTGKAIRFKNDPGNEHSLSQNRIRDLAKDDDGFIWVGTDEGGLNRLDPDKGIFERFTHRMDDSATISTNKIFSLFFDRDGILWIGTIGGGLDRFNIETGEWRHFKSKAENRNSISSDYVLCMYQSKSGTFWVGTMDGFNQFDPEKGIFTRYSLKDGLPDKVIYGILEDEQSGLWLSTNKGISRFDARTETFKNYDITAGLQSNEFNTYAALKTTDGRMLFGGINGYNVFNPDDIRDDPIPPKIRISNFQVFNKDVPIGELLDGRVLLEKSISETNQITLSHRSSVFSFEFVALHFSSPENNQYACMMQGVDKDWNYMGYRRYVTYASLPAGNFTFRVKAANHDGVWNEKGAEIQLNILPPPWKTWWAYTLYALFLMGITVWFIRYEKQKVHIKQKEIERVEKLVQARTAEVLSQKEELQKFSIVASETDNAIFIMDPNGNLEWINQGFTKMYELSFEELVQNFGPNVRDSSSHPDIDSVLLECLETRKPVSFETFRKTKSGKAIWAQTNLAPVLNSDNEVIKLVSIDSDITKIKLAEKAAERANQFKSEFLARMSHEIRTPMNGVIGFADMLLDTDLSAEQIDYATTITRSGEAMVALLNDILDFSKIEAGKLPFDPIDFDPEVTVFDVYDLILSRIDPQKIEVLCRIGDNVPAFVRADAGRFRQVLMNLMGNAAKFTESGEIELSLQVEQEQEKKLKLHVLVRDTGVGIPPEKISTVFEAFRQADGSTTRKYGGTGLGLTISKQIANMMNGDVWVESQEGKGSTFHFTCWVRKTGKKPEKERIYSNLSGKHILIVDDNHNNLEILSHILSRSQIRVKAILKPQDAIAEIQSSIRKNEPFDLAIIDIQMPGMSGFELVEQIRGMGPPASHMPILAFSSSCQTRSREYKERGFDGFLPKPIQRHKLLKILEQLLAKTETSEKVSEKSPLLTQHAISDHAKHSVHILLAEDNPVSMKLARFLLQKAGYRVTSAQNGREAVDLFCSTPDSFQLILMDVHMPDLNGKQATRIIREQGFHEIPIIAMTAEAMVGDKEKCIQAGMNDYIPKPIKREVVYKIVKRWCLKG